jgi:biotin synthase
MKLSDLEIKQYLQCRGKAQQSLHQHAVEVRNQTISNQVFLRGLIELSNQCINDCYYCGIRKSNSQVKRYALTDHQAMDAITAIHRIGISSMVLQSGERRDSEFIQGITTLIDKIKTAFPDMHITLSLGEQSKETYQQWFDTGASRYLLRIETATQDHYRQLHPPEMSFEYRKQCLTDLRKIGYQVGSGVMILSPLQTLDNLVADLRFLKEMDIDMCGMGPYIPHRHSPLKFPDYSAKKALNLGLNMIALLRLLMPDINIAATTALETLSSHGRELGLSAGANVIMPQFSPAENRPDYQLYDNKPCFTVDENQLILNLIAICQRAGMIAELKDPGTAKHFLRRN